MKRGSNGLRLYEEFLALRAKKQPQLALEKLRQAARYGEVMAKHALAYQIEGDPARLQRALRLYREAAHRGFSPSAVNLARHFEAKGQASGYFRWLRRAVELGDPDAEFEIKNPAPYLYERAVKEIAAGRIQAGIAALRKAANMGNLAARAELKSLRDDKKVASR